MTRLTIVLLGFMNVALLPQPVISAVQGQSVDPKLILQKSAAACLKVNTIEYVEDQIVEGQNAGSPALTATIRQGRAPVPAAGFLPGKFVVAGAIHEPGSGRRDFAFSYDGMSLRLLDHSDKVVRVAKSPDARAAGSLLASVGLIGIPQFTQDEPFKAVIDKADGYTYEGTSVIQETPCHVVSVVQTIDHPSLGKRTFTVRWFIGVEDGLPRGNQIGGIRKTIRILHVNPSGSSTDYALATPGGYSEKLVTGNEAKNEGLLAAGSIAPD